MTKENESVNLEAVAELEASAVNSLVMRLRQHALPDPYDEREVLHAPLLIEAADKIEKLQRNLLREREAMHKQMVEIDRAYYDLGRAIN
jgi:hypothetical protein